MSISEKIKAPFGTNRSDLRYYLYLLLCAFLIAHNYRLTKQIYKIMDIKTLKKELGLSNSDIAEFFQIKPLSYAQSSAKTRYESGICKIYELSKKLHTEQINELKRKIQEL